MAAIRPTKISSCSRQQVSGVGSRGRQPAKCTTSVSHVSCGFPTAHTFQARKLAFRTTVGCAATEPEAKKAVEVPSPSVLDVRVGKILSVERHPDADSLYIESIDVGEEEPRTIVSGLVKYVGIEDMQDRNVVVLCNLKPRNMRGIKSHGMVLCACAKDDGAVEPLDAPAAAPSGERVYFGDEQEQAEPETANRVQKKKMWDALQPLLRTGEDRVAQIDGKAMNTSAGPVTAKTLASCEIS